MVNSKTIEKTKKNQNNLGASAKALQNHRENQKKPKKPKISTTMGVNTWLVVEILGFFGFFWFSRWFCYAFAEALRFFLIFLGFLNGFAISLW
jgi:hypothetical protein